MSVTRDDVRRMASLARIAVDETRFDALAGDLEGILRHMVVLQRDERSAGEGVDDAPTPGPRDEDGPHVGAEHPAPGRDDMGTPIPLARSISSFAPRMRDGFFLVPRLATHGSSHDAMHDQAHDSVDEPAHASPHDVSDGPAPSSTHA